MARQSGAFQTLGGLGGAVIATMMLVGSGGAFAATPMLGALVGIIGGGAAGGIVGGVVDTVLNKTVGKMLHGDYHHNPQVRKLQRESERDGKAHTDLNAHEAENRLRQMEKDAAKEEIQREWQQRIEEERAAVEKNVYSSSGRG